MKFYLEQLIYALSEADVSRLRNMPLRKSKMKYYLEILVENRKSGIPPNQMVMKKLNLDNNALMKMRSLILSKCLAELVPRQGTELLYFLSRYRLNEIFVRETDKLITEISHNKSVTSNQKAEIYLQAIRGYFKLPLSLYDGQKMNAYMKGFLLNNSKPDKAVFQEVIKLNEIYILILKSSHRMDTSESNYKFFLKELKGVKERAARLNSRRLEVFIQGIHLILDFYYTSNWSGLEPKFEKLIQAYNSLNSQEVYYELFGAKYYRAVNKIMQGKSEEANKLFEKMEDDYADLFQHTPHVIYWYSISLMMEGRNRECKGLINNYLKKDLLAFDPDATVMCCVAYTAYHLLENELEEASKYIGLFNSIGNRKDLFSYALSIRLFEIVYYYQRGDEKFAAAQLKKLTRYLRDKSSLHGAKVMLPVVSALSGIFNRHLSAKSGAQNFENEINKAMGRSHTLVGKLFMNAANVRAAVTQARASYAGRSIV